MSYPEYIPTRQVTFGGAATLEAGEDLTISLHITASRKGLIWSPTGYWFPSVESLFSADLAAEGTTFLPVTNADGWRDAATGQMIDVSAPDTHTHTYKGRFEFRRAGAKVSEITVNAFIVPAGEGPLDIDLMFPVESTPGQLVSVPDSYAAGNVRMWTTGDAAPVLPLSELARWLLVLDSDDPIPAWAPANSVVLRYS